MRPCLVKVHHLRLEHALELLLLKNQQVVQTFLPDAPQEAFADRIGSGSVKGRLEKLDTAGCRHPSKAGPKFAVVITYQILGCLSIGGGFSQLLGHPGIGRRSSDPDMDHPSRLQFDEEERKQRPKEQIGHLLRSRRPRSALRGCAKRSTISVLVAAVSERFSCTSEWCACTPECPISRVPRECA